MVGMDPGLRRDDKRGMLRMTTGERSPTLDRIRAATCSGWWIGASTTPIPRRIALVRWLTAAKVRSGALLCDHTGRK